MKKKIFLGLVTVFLLNAWNLPAALSTNMWQVTNTQTFETQASSGEEASENVLKIVKDDSAVPEICKKRALGTTCSQATQIKVEVNTIWTIIEAAPIDSESLTTTEFAKNYPNISETGELTNDSSEEDKLIAQKILYERGMLALPPTGFLGHLTKMAVTHLQNVKNIYDEPNRIGPKTIKELNDLKKRMEEDGYVENNPLPEPDPTTFAPNLREVYLDHATKVELIKNHPGFYKTTTVETPIDDTPLPSINYFGEIKLQPQE